MNRRLMMAQQNKGFELVYDAASGILPNENEWYYRAGRYNGSVAVGGKPTIENNCLRLKVNHMNESAHYALINHQYASNSEMSVTVEEWNGPTGYYPNVISIGLTDGYNYAWGTVSTKGLIANSKGNANCILGVTYVATFDLPEKFTFKLKRENNVAYYYLDDELIYVNTEIEPIETFTFGTAPTDKITNTAVNLFGAGNTTDYISKVIYKEW